MFTVYNQSPTLNNFSEVEKSLDIQLPPSYKEFLQQTNGLLLGDTQYILIKKEEKPFEMALWNMWGIDPQDPFSSHYLNFFFRNNELKNTLPQATFSIGFNADVETLLMDEDGKIFLIKNNEIISVAASISEFVSSIQTYPELEKVTSVDFRSTEKYLNKTLPKEYKDLLMKLNKDTFRQLLEKKYFFSKTDKKEECILSELYIPNSNVVSKDLLEMTKLFKERMPSEYIPIGEDPGGNQFCLAIDGPNSGNIYYWDHESESENQPYYDNLFPISKVIDFFDLS